MTAEAGPQAREIRLLWRVFAANAVVLVSAGLALALSPATVSFPIGPLQALVLLAGVLLLLAVNLVLLRRAMTAFNTLVTGVATIDPDARGVRLDVTGAGPDVGRIGEAINDMLERIEHERDANARRRIAAEEQERRRIARDLHDEVGQLITVALLQIDHAATVGTEDAPDRLVAARRTLEDIHTGVREIARRLRPAALDDLGLASALVMLAHDFAAPGAPPVHTDIDPTAAAGLSEEVELALYRIAQEASSNALRHARPRSVWLRLQRDGDEVVLTVADDGTGIAAEPTRGMGLPAMRERAGLVGGRLDIASDPVGGTVVSLRLRGGQHPLPSTQPTRTMKP